MTAADDDWEAMSMREHGRVLTGKHCHWCGDWDYMTVDETTQEWSACTCYPHEVYAECPK